MYNMLPPQAREIWHLQSVGLILAMILVSVFRNWNLLATVITCATLIAYLTGPVTTITLRKIAPDLERPYKPNYMRWFAPLTFVLKFLIEYIL